MTTESAPATSPGSAMHGGPEWAEWPDDRLLDLRFCDLKIGIEGSWLAQRIEELHLELQAKGLAFEPHYWLSDEWFTPDGMTGIAIPFYLAHPRLAKLEETMMLEVEGGSDTWCMKILRHEAGHAIDNAYKLQRRRKRQKVFGLNSVPYPEFYSPKPYSKSYVVHLDSWYAQSHPAEDFAETFAVWLTPDSEWRSRYADWPALKKLEYMHDLMADIAGKPPVVDVRQQLEPLPTLRKTLRTHYKQRRDHYGLTRPGVFDRELRRLFTDAPDAAGNMTAARFLSRIRKDVRRRVAGWSGIHQYTIDQVFEDIIARCQLLKLRLAGPEDQTRMDFMVLLTVQTMNYLHSGRHRMAV